MKRTSIFKVAVQRGVTLIELLVAIIIGLVVTLAVTSAVIVGEQQKRSTMSINDMGQTGAFAAYVLDRAARSAGSAFTQSWQQGVPGCKLNVNGKLPSGTALPAPFKTSFLGGTPNNVRVAPLLIAKNQSDGGSDVLMILGGTGAAGGIPRRVTGTGSATTLVVDNTVAFAAGDLALVSQSGTADCLLEQVASTTATTLTLGGTYYMAGSSTTLASLASSLSTYVTPLGNVNAPSSIQFQLFGVGANRTLFSYDLLQLSSAQAQAIADGVAEMHAVYGLDTNNDGLIDSWADPGATGFDIATLMATPATLRQIIAVRVALVMRSDVRETKVVSPATLSYFSDLTNSGGTSLKQTTTLSSAVDQYYRYQVIETTIPLRNMLLLPNT